MEFTTALLADLEILSSALDTTNVDIEVSLRQLANDAKLAVDSFVGLTVQVVGHPQFSVTLSDADLDPASIQTSILVSVERADSIPCVALIMYASAPGTFVDVAADLAWLTGQSIASFALDQHLDVALSQDSSANLREWSQTNQAIGVLIGCGHSPESALDELDAWAVDTGVDRASAAGALLANLDATNTSR